MSVVDYRCLGPIREVSLLRQSSLHEANHCQLNHRLGAADRVFGILGQPAASHDPGEGCGGDAGAGD